MNMSILLTAFKGVHNSSYRIVQKFEHDKLYLTNSYNGIDRDVSGFDFIGYNAVIMFGLDKNLKDSIRIEPQAVLDNTVQNTIYDVVRVKDILGSLGVDAVIAKRPTAYLCNRAYYKVLEIMRGRALFIHIPPERYLKEEMKTNIQKAISAIEDIDIIGG